MRIRRHWQSQWHTFRRHLFDDSATPPCFVRRLSAADATAFGLLDGSDISGATCEPFEAYLERPFGRDPAS